MQVTVNALKCVTNSHLNDTQHTLHMFCVKEICDMPARKGWVYIFHENLQSPVSFTDISHIGTLII